MAMNRDERRDRAPEAPPTIRASWGPWIAPSDGAAGGTWMAASSLGFVGCVLNRYQDQLPAGRTPARSRGDVLGILCDALDDPEDLRAVPDLLRPADFAPFTLLLATRRGSTRFDWNGSRLTRRPLPAPLALVTSSSWRTASVLAWRRRAFARWSRAVSLTPEGIPAIHLHAPDGHAMRAPMMQREQSATRSVTVARLDWKSAACEVRHWPVADGALQRESPRRAIRLA